MNAYTEITFDVEGIAWESIAGDAYEVPVTCISSAPFLEQVAASGQWTGDGGSAVLSKEDEPGDGEILIKASATPDTAEEQTFTITALPGFTTLTSFEQPTAESGMEISGNRLWFHRGADRGEDSLSGSVLWGITPLEQ
jgi:hypothetical protein